MGKIKAFCYYSVSSLDCNKYVISLGGKEYAYKPDTISFKAIVTESVQKIEELVGKGNFKLYCNEVDSVNTILNDMKKGLASGIYSENVMIAKKLKDTTQYGIREDKRKVETVEENGMRYIDASRIKWDDEDYNRLSISIGR